MSAPHTIRMLSWGGVGDAILTTPALRALRAKYPGSRLLMYCQSRKHGDVFLHNPNLDGVILLGNRRHVIERFRFRFQSRQFKRLNYGRMEVTMSYHKPAQCIIGDLLGVEVDDPQLQLFLTPAEDAAGRARLEPLRTPVIINSVSRACVNISWPHEHWVELVARNPDIDFLQVGLADERQIAGAVDWRGRLSLRETFALMKHARACVGVVTGLTHAAAAFGTPGVVLHGPAQPEIWGDPSHTNLYEALPCSPCLDLLADTRCPYGARCMSSIAVGSVERALRVTLGLAPHEPTEGARRHAEALWM